MSKFLLEARKRVVVNTDPERRCYNGVHFSSEEVWGNWFSLGYRKNRSDAEDSMATFKRINPSSEYRITEVPGELI